MTDPGSPQFPSGNPRVGEMPLPPARPEIRVQVLDASGRLHDVPRPVRLEAEVVRRNTDGTVLLRTDQGDIKIKIPSARDIPPGERIQIDLSAGQPPKQAVIRAAPPDAAEALPLRATIPVLSVPSSAPPSFPPQTQKTQTTLPTQSPPAEEPGYDLSPAPPELAPIKPATLPAPAISPVQIQDISLQPVPVQTPAPPRPLAAGQIVRLTPLPDSITLPLIPLSKEMPLTAQASIIFQKTAFAAALTPLRVFGEQTDDLLKIPAAAKESPPVTISTVPRGIPALSSPRQPLPVTPLTLIPSSVPQTIYTSPLQHASLNDIFPAPAFSSLPPPVIETIGRFLIQPAFTTLQNQNEPAPLAQDIKPPPAVSFQERPLPLVLTFPEEKAMAATLAHQDKSIVKTLVSPTPGSDSLPLAIPAQPAAPAAQDISPAGKNFLTPETPLPPAQRLVTNHLDIRILDIQPPPPVFTTPAESPETIDIPAEDKKRTIPSLFQPDPLPKNTAGTAIAHIEGITIQNFPVISSPETETSRAQNFIMQFSAESLPTGSMISFVPLPEATTAPPSAEIPMPHAPATAAPTTTSVSAPYIMPYDLLMAGLPWPAMDDLSQTLQQTAPQLFTQTITQIVPNTAQPANLPATALLFIAALRSGDISGWLGDKTVDTLRRSGRSEIVTRLARDFSSLSRLESDPSPAREWRSLPLPLYADGQMHKIMLHYRRDEKDRRDDDKKNVGTRFILDLSLTRMGAVQIDGLVRGNKMDIRIRTQSTLSAAMQNEIRRRYVHVMETAGLSGELAFHAGKDTWIKVPLPALDHARNVSV